MKSALLIAGFSVLTLALSGVLKELHPKSAPFLLAGAGLILWAFFLKTVLPLIQYLAELAKAEGLSEMTLLLFEALAVGMIMTLVSSLSRDLGENGFADKIDLAAVGIVTALSLPLIKTFFELVKGLVT